MNEDNMNLNELEELRKSYHLMDEKLDGQEIVTPEKIRAVIEKKVNLLKKGLIKVLIAIYVGLPLVTILMRFRKGLPDLAWWTMGIYSLVVIGINIFLLSKVSRKDFVEFNLNTLMHREKRCRRIYLSLIVITSVFWVVFGFLFEGRTIGFFYLFVLLLFIAPRNYPILVQTFKTGLQEKYDIKPTLLARIVTIAVIAIAMLWIIAIFILNMIASWR